MEAPISMRNRLWMWLKYAVSVFRRFSTRYFGICHFFLRYCGIGYPPMSPSLKDGLESVQNPKPFSEHRLRSTPPCLLLVPSSASKPPKNVGYSSKIFPTKSHLVFCKRTLWSPPWTTGLKKRTRNEGLLVASALNGLLSVLTGSEDSGVNALKQHRQYKYQRLPDILSSFRGNVSSDMTSYGC